MKYCPQCGAAITVSTASFCPKCGKAIQKTSPAKKRRPPEDYDGYYRDIPVADGGQVKERFDPELAKRIVLLAVGVVVVIVLAILAMYFL